MSKIKTTLFWLSALAVGTFFGVKHELESRINHSVRCAMITDIGPIQTMSFDDENVKEEGGVIKGKTTVYRLGNHEICLIEETDK